MRRRQLPVRVRAFPGRFRRPGLSRRCASDGNSEVARSRFAEVLRKLIHPAFDWLMICLVSGQYEAKSTKVR